MRKSRAGPMKAATKIGCGNQALGQNDGVWLEGGSIGCVFGLCYATPRVLDGFSHECRWDFERFRQSLDEHSARAVAEVKLSKMLTGLRHFAVAKTTQEVILRQPKLIEASAYKRLYWQDFVRHLARFVATVVTASRLRGFHLARVGRLARTAWSVS